VQITLKQIDKELREIATKHTQIQSYYFGEELEIQEANKLDNCTLFANVNDANISTSFVTLNLIIAVLDKINTDKSNLLDVESDTLQIVNDIYHVLQYSNRWQEWGIVDQVGSTQKLYEHTDSILGGWSITINLKIKANKGICDTAFNGYNFD